MYIKIVKKQTPVWNLVRNVSDPEIEMKDVRLKSRFIECLLLRIPLPESYLIRLDPELEILFGQHQIYAVKEFITGLFPLTGLKLCPEHEGKFWGDLDKNVKSRIKNTQVITHIIEPETDEEALTFIRSSIKLTYKLNLDSK